MICIANGKVLAKVYQKVYFDINIWVINAGIKQNIEVSR